MRIAALLLSACLTPGAAMAQSGRWPAWLSPAPQAVPLLPPDGQARPGAIPAAQAGAPHAFLPGAPASFPLGIYANPLMLFAVKGLIGQLSAHRPPAPAPAPPSTPATTTPPAAAPAVAR